MAETWNATDEVYDIMKQLVANSHPDLASCVDQIAIVFKEKASKSGDAVIAGKTSKANSLFGVLGDVDYKFIITLGFDVWGEYTAQQKVALLDHHLCACRAVEKEPGGVCRYYVQPPDVSFYKDEVERHGFWRTSGSKPDESIIHDLFGEETEEE